MSLFKTHRLLILIGSVCTHLSVMCAQQSYTGMVVDGLEVKFDTGMLTYRDLPAEFKGFPGQPIFHVQLIGREDVPNFDMKFTLKSSTSIKRIIPATGSQKYGYGNNMMELNMSVPKLAQGQKMNFYVILGREYDVPTLDAKVHITRTIGRNACFLGPIREHDGRPIFFRYKYISIEKLVPNFSEIAVAKLLPNKDKSSSAAPDSNLLTKGSTEQEDLTAQLLADLLLAASDMAHGIKSLQKHLIAIPQQTSDPVELIDSTSQSEDVGNIQPDENAL